LPQPERSPFQPPQQQQFALPPRQFNRLLLVPSALRRSGAKLYPALQLHGAGKVMQQTWAVAHV
jgi:hypothetical protein